MHTKRTLSSRAAISVDMVKEKWLKGETQGTEGSRSFHYKPLTRPLQGPAQHVSYLSVYYLLLNHTPTQSVWNSRDLVTHSILEMYRLYILWFASCRDVLSYGSFTSITQETNIKLKQRPKTKLTIHNVQLLWHLEIHPFIYTSIRLQVLILICVTIHGPRLKI